MVLVISFDFFFLHFNGKVERLSDGPNDDCGGCYKMCLFVGGTLRHVTV